MARQPQVNQDLLNVEASRPHSDTPHSVALLWMSDRPDAENSDNIQHPHETEIQATGKIPTRNLSRRTPADPSLRWYGHWDHRTIVMPALTGKWQSNA